MEVNPILSKYIDADSETMPFALYHAFSVVNNYNPAMSAPFLQKISSYDVKDIMNQHRFIIYSDKEHKLFPIDFIPKITRYNLTNLQILYPYKANSDSSPTKTASRFKSVLQPILDNLLDKHPICLRNLEYWDIITEKFRNYNLVGSNLKEMEQLALDNYFESEVCYGQLPLKLDRLVLHIRNSGTGAKSLNYYNNDYLGILNDCKINCLFEFTASTYSYSVKMSKSLVVGSMTNNVIFGIFIKSQYLKEYYEAYESTNIDAKSFSKRTEVSRLYGSQIPQFMCRFNPEWFTIVFNLDEYNKYINGMSSSEKASLADYFRHYISPLLKYVNNHNEVNQTNQFTILNEYNLAQSLSTLKVNIKSHLNMGLNNYEKESREFLATLSRIN